MTACLCWIAYGLALGVWSSYAVAQPRHHPLWRTTWYASLCLTLLWGMRLITLLRTS